MHRLLARQLRRHLGTTEVPEELRAFMESVARAYEGYDNDRTLLERSTELSSKELHEINVELRAVLAAVPDVFLWIDRDGRIVNVKEGDVSHRHLAAVELVGKNVKDLPIAEVASTFVSALDTVRESHQPVMIEYEQSIEKRPSIFEARFLPVTDDKTLAIVRDITDTRRVELAEAANREKSEFLANMSHELRTPLHGILSFARFGLKRVDRDGDSGLFNYFEQIEGSGETLLELLNDLLDMAKMEARKANFEFKETDLQPLLEAEIDQFHSRFSEKQLVLKSALGDGPREVLADGARIRQVIRNLLGNAVKFSREGGWIEVQTSMHDGQGTVSVTNEGDGIPEAELECIFDKFVQSSRTKTGAGGTGLGLAICREIIERHGGRIWAENVAGVGPRLTFSVPLPERAKVGGGELATEVCDEEQ